MASLFAAASQAWALPTRTEIYRSEKLHTIVYKDGTDPDVFWFVPPVKLYESDGKVVFYKRAKDGKVRYYFYVVPYMTDDLIELLSGEIPGLQNKGQLKPITAKQFGIQVKQFDTLSLGDQVTDYQYLNQPQMVRVTLADSEASEFEFFIQNKPGVQANVLIHFDSERMDKYLTIELTYREVYNALNIGATGKYQFTRAEIEAGVTNYVSKKYFTIKSKGDLQIPDIVNKVIEECFTPYKKPDQKKDRSSDWEDWLTERVYSSCDPEVIKDPQVAQVCSQQVGLYYDLLQNDLDPSGGGWDSGDWGGSNNNNKKKSADGVQFVFKKDLANSDKAFYFKQEHFADSSEIIGIPIFLSLAPEAARTKILVTPSVKKDLVVEATASKQNPMRTGINIQAGSQYTINSVFALSAQTPYDSGTRWFRWSSKWPAVDEDLYYRVGNGPWTKVSGRAVLKTDGIYQGELQFYLDRDRIWEKIPKEYKDPKMLGLVPAIFTYKQTFPQFNVVVNGRKIDLN